MSRDAAIMANSTKSNTPWMVRTTKRKAPASAPQPKKRQRLSFDGRNVPRSRQQTLTQIQFAPYMSSPSKFDGLESIDIMTTRTSKERRKPRRTGEQPRELGAARTRKGPKKQRSTLTQMDFLTLRRQEHDMEEDELGMITPGGVEEVDIEAEKENIDPDAANTTTRAKRRADSTAGQRQHQSRKRRREVADGAIADDLHLPDRTPRAINRGGLHGQALSEQRSNGSATDATISTTTRKTRATTTKTDALLPQVESHDKSVLDDSGDVDSNCRRVDWVFPRTPQRTRDVIPSSQSPESVSISTKRRSVLRRQESVASPLKERSRNVTPSKSLSARRSLGFGSSTNGLSPKRKICVLKYGPCRFEMPDLSRAEDQDMDEGSPTARKPQAATMRQSRHHTKQIESDGNLLNPAQDLIEPEIPETSQIAQLNVIPSSQTDNEDEAEIPETSQGLRRVASTPSLNRSEESLQMLSNTHHTPSTATKQRRMENHRQPDSESDVQVHDFGLNAFDGGCKSKEGSLVPRQSWSESENTHQRLPAKLPRLQSGISTIDDSQDEDHDDLIARVPATTTNVNQLVSASSRPDLPPPAHSNPLSSPSLPPAPLLARPPSYPPATITRVPTKLPPISSSPSSSPNLFPPPRLTTQQSIRPASMPRPSQVSTQASTLQSWLPMSSMPFANSAMTSSPSNHHNVGLELESHVTIKDSSSSSPSLPLRDIPSQPRSQLEAEFAMVDLGFGIDDNDDEGDEDLDARDEDLDPKSSPQQLVHPHYRDEEEDDNIRSPSTNREDPISKKAVTNPSIHQRENPHPRENQKKPKPSPSHIPHAPAPLPPPSNQNYPTLNLPDSLLESLPAPPGWVGPSQPDSLGLARLDFEDEML